MRVAASGKPRRGLEWLVTAGPVILFLASTTGLVLAFDYPAILDYYNHYARMWLIAGGIEQAPFDEIYVLDWSNTTTNIAIDWVAFVTSPAVGIDALIKFVFLLAIILPPIGAAFVHIEAFGRASVWQAGFFYFAWSATLVGGFINFQIGIGLALIGGVIDHRLIGTSSFVRALLRIVFSVLLALVHIFSVALFVLVVCAFIFGSRFDTVLNSARQIRQKLGELTLAFLTMAVGPVLLIVTAESPPGSGGDGIYWGESVAFFVSKFLSPFWTYDLVIDLILLLPIVTFFVAALVRRDIRFHAGLVVAFAILCLLTLVAPHSALGTGFVGWRFPLMAALVGVAMVLPFAKAAGSRTTGGSQVVTAMFIMLVAATTARTAWVGYQWLQNRPDVEATIAAIAAAPSGAAILPVAREVKYIRGTMPPHRYFGGTGGDTFRHIPALAVPMFHDVVPNLFAARGKQPLRVQPEWTGIAVEEMNVITPHALECADLRPTVNNAHLIGWYDKFDYVLELNADASDVYIADRVPSGLVLVADHGFAALYRIDRKAVDELTLAGARCGKVTP